MIKLVHPWVCQEIKDLYASVIPWAARATPYSFPDPIVAPALENPANLWRLVTVDDNIIGLVGFESISVIDRCAEPTIALLPQYQGKGYGVQLAQALKTIGINELGLHRIQSYVLPDSISCKLLVKMGCKLEGVLRKARFRDGKFIDVCLYGWVKEE